MAVYSSSEYSTNAPIAVHGERKGVQMARATVACTAAPSTSDTLNFFYMPPGARVVGGYLSATDMDTNGSPTITLNIGDAGGAARLFSASTVAQAGTTSQTFAAGALDYPYAAKTLVTGVAQANAATGAAGSVTLTLLYVVEE
jgi:hypothetical protein